MKPFEKATRRSFLRAVGAGAAALPFYRMLEDSVAKRRAPPCRFDSSASITRTASPPSSGPCRRATRRPSSTSATRRTACSLQPFDDAATYGKSFKDKILLIEGIDLLSNANGHDTAGTILTGSRIDRRRRSRRTRRSISSWRSSGISARPPRSPASRSGVGNDATESGTTLSFGPGGAPLPKIIDPVQAFNMLFANYVPTNDPAAQAAALRHRALGQSVVDFVKGDINRLRPKLAAPEQQKLDQHLDSLRDLEKQLDAATTGAGAGCVPAGPPDASKFPQLKQYNGGEPYFDAITNAHIDMLAQAFACDITRFATLFMADLSYSANPLGLPADNHGGVAHTYNGSALGSDGHPVGAGDPASLGAARQVQSLLLLEGRAPDAEARRSWACWTTLIYASSDMGNPALHSTRNVPTVLAGGANGKFRMGRRLKMAADCPSDEPVVLADRRDLHGDRQQQAAGVHRAGVRSDGRHELRDADQPRLDRRHAGQSDLTRPGTTASGAFPDRFPSPGNALSSFC